MKYSRNHVADGALLHSLRTRDALDRTNLVELLVDLAEVEKRRLYVPAGYSKLYDFCLSEMNWSEDMAGMRLRVARAGRRFHGLLDAIAEGRLHLTGAFLIAKHMSPRNCDELLNAAMDQSCTAIKQYLAARYPSPDVPALIRVIEAGPMTPGVCNSSEPLEHALLESHSPGSIRANSSNPLPANVDDAISRPAAPAPARVTPLSASSRAVQFTMHDPMSHKLQRFGALASHRVRPGDLAALFEYALEIGIAVLEKRKFAATDHPRASSPPNSGSRTIPAAVRREVYDRDGGRCTFVGDDGHRCDESHQLEFDHIVPVARGGESTVGNLRLLCRTHNQYAADLAFGAGFMERKRESARQGCVNGVT